MSRPYECGTGDGAGAVLLGEPVTPVLLGGLAAVDRRDRADDVALAVGR